MTPKERAKKMLPFMQAMAEGKTIQVSRITGADKNVWADLSNPFFDFVLYHYRIKPEPRVVWHLLNKYDEAMRSYFSEKLANQDLAYYNKAGHFGPYTLVKFVEELES